jgi:hypothetical protein
MSLREHYLRTTYRVSGVTPAIDIRVGEACPALDALLEAHAARCWAFITAWNPGSRKLDEADNRRRQARFEADMKQAGYVFLRGAGVPDDERGWQPEESLLVVGLKRDDAVEWGRKCGQAAVVTGVAGDKAELVFTSEEVMK